MYVHVHANGVDANGAAVDHSTSFRASAGVTLILTGSNSRNGFVNAFFLDEPLGPDQDDKQCPKVMGWGQAQWQRRERNAQKGGHVWRELGERGGGGRRQSGVVLDPCAEHAVVPAGLATAVGTAPGRNTQSHATMGSR